MTTGSIGVFDSGVGGLSVLREIRALLPDADLRYLADHAYAPYGERSLLDVRERAFAVSRYLIGSGARVVVVACNSASAAALHELRAAFPETAFVGMEPAVKPAAASSGTRVIGVMATEATFQGELFASVVDRHARGVAVIARACPGLAAAIEDDAPDLADQVRSHVLPIVDRGADVIVLGCTHYALVAGAISAAAGPSVAVIDPAPAVARRLAAVLGEEARYGSGATLFATTGDPAAFARQLRRILGRDAEVETVAIAPK